MVQAQGTPQPTRKEMIFRMKQFEIRQDRSALKVGTDGVLLGAYIGDRYKDVHRVLDVGTGTGVIALMLAKSLPDAAIDGIEIDAPSADEAAINAAHSPFADRIRIIQGDFGDRETDAPFYDMIVSNPPYFTATHHTADERTTAAKHIGDLTPTIFFSRASSFLLPFGRIAIIIAMSSLRDFVSAASAFGFSVEHLVYIRTVSHRLPKRAIIVYAAGEHPSCSIEYLTIHSGTGDRHDYTPAYRELLTPFLTIF